MSEKAEKLLQALCGFAWRNIIERLDYAAILFIGKRIHPFHLFSTSFRAQSMMEENPDL